MSADAPDDTQLAAYLAGDLDELAARRIEARLAEDPELGARLDRLHGTLLALRDPDAVEPPPGLSERLSQRLDEEAARAASSAGATAGSAAAADSRAPAPAGGTWRDRFVVPLQRQLGTAAAVIAALVLLGGSVLVLSQPGGEDTGDQAMDAADGEDALETEDSADSDAPRSMDEGDDGDDAAGGDESAAGEESLEDDSEGPESSSPSALDQPIPRWRADVVAEERWQDMPEREAACRDDVEEAAPGPAVPVDVTASPADPDVRVYEVMTVVGDGDTLDRIARVSVDSRSCEVVDMELDD